MREDNLDTFYRSSEQFIPKAVAEQGEEFLKEERGYLAEAGIIDETIQHLTERIAHYKSTDAIDPGWLFSRRDTNHVLAANKIVAENLEMERSRLLSIRQAFKSSE